MPYNPKAMKKVEWEGPLGASNSFTAWTISDKCKHSMEFFLDTDRAGGSIEWIYMLDTDQEDAVEIGLEFGYLDDLKDGKLQMACLGYDGVFALPKQAIELMESLGIDCAEMRKTGVEDDDETQPDPQDDGQED